MKEKANIIKCSNNVRLISLALHLYAADHGEVFPDSLSVLYPDYIKNEKIFDCPAGGKRGTVELPSYEYIAGLTESSGGTEVILYDKKGSERNVWGQCRFAGKLRHKRFDFVIHCHGTNRMHLAAWLAGVYPSHKGHRPGAPS